MYSQIENNFVATWNDFARAIHETAQEKGWWDEERNDGEVIALIHSELSACLEALRYANRPSVHIPEFSGVEEELADAVIRIMDYAFERGFDVPGALIDKMLFNQSRYLYLSPKHKHGGKKF